LEIRIFPIYVRQRTEPLAEKRDYGTADSQCGAERELAVLAASHWPFLIQIYGEKKHEYPE
jgi:hypothetical protein